ncbi:hypothetical protein JVT61DRAFT_238 [Boletus reticuloceps]|uniref:Non-haem dioxygenase N-terminal domain-containing protein n=1 Tax=Boletus reticuloceps TaxID=495285 RepID=A0A8I2YY60_9AGAM|nr:hypothetical protein JVT61DRAFT_238 [Boletus reticuloceps]
MSSPPKCSRPDVVGSHRLDFAGLVVIDLSKAHTPEGRAELAPQLRDALRTNGFVYAINHGYTQAQVSLITFQAITHHDRIFDIADMLFTAVPPEEMTRLSRGPRRFKQ